MNEDLRPPMASTKVRQDGMLVEIDLREANHQSEANRNQFRKHLRESLRETGFVSVAGHEIDRDDLEEAHTLFENFFDQSLEEKSRVGGVSGGQRGFTPFGIETALHAPRPDLKEFFHVGQERTPRGSNADFYPENIWPDRPPQLREVALRLYRDLEKIACALLEEIALAFGLPRTTLSDMIVNGNSILRALHYPPVAEACDPLALRAAPHEDINLITLLCAASDEGLEICLRNGEWIEVQSRPGTLIADVGDMLARITNDQLPATTHRVVARGPAAKRHRYALPFFAHPRPECDLSVLPTFLGPGENAKYPPITASDFLEERLREIGLIQD